MSNLYPLKKIKYIYDFKTGFTPETSDSASYSKDENGYDWITISDMKGKYISKSSQKLTEKGVKGRGKLLVKKGSLLYSFKLSVGKVAFAEKDLYTNEAIASFYSDEYDLNYLYYTAPLYIEKNANINIYGAKILNQELIRNAKIPFPSLEKQKKIVEILDKKISVIDEQIKMYMNEIFEAYKYRQSIINEITLKGLNKSVKLIKKIDWIGEIPEHWIIDKFNRICNVITDYVASGSFADLAKNVTYKEDEDYAMLIRTTDLSNKNKNTSPLYVDKHSYKFLKNSNLFGGEIILPNIGASIGDVYIVPKLYERMTLGPNSILIKTKYVDKYYYYLFSTQQYRNALIIMGESSAQSKFNKTNFKQFKGVIPPIDEQKEIVEVLDKKCEEIDDYIRIKKNKVEELKLYKKTLTYEYVSGVKEV